MMTTRAVERALEGRNAFWGAPTYDQVRIGWGEAKKMAGAVADFKQTTGTITFPNGATIIYRSLDNPDNARGHSFQDAYFDEVADIKPEAYYNVVFPILANYEDSTFNGIGTPKGRNWFFREHLNAKSVADSASFQIPTLGCKIVDGKLIRNPHPQENPDFPWSEVQRMFQTMPQLDFEQEILAQFIEGQGVVFRNIPACMNAPQTTPEEHKGHYIVAGGDWGKQNDYTTVSVGCATCHVELDKDRFNQIDYHFQRSRLELMCTKWNVSNLLVELNSMGEPNFEELQRSGLPVSGFTTTAQSKPPLIENMALALEKEEWQFQADPIWTGELEAYERKISSTTGRSSYSAPDGMHDDTVIARALMLRAADSGRIWTYENNLFD